MNSLIPLNHRISPEIEAVDFAAPKFPSSILARLAEVGGDGFGPYRKEIHSLSKETDPELFFEALFHLGQKIEKAGKTELAALVYSVVAAGQAAPFYLQQEAKERLNVLGGGGSIGAQLEHMGRGFAQQALDPGLLIGATGMGLFGKGVELLGVGWLSKANFFRKTIGIGRTAMTVLPKLGGFAAEATVFPFAVNGANEMLGRPANWQGMDERVVSSWFFLGGMKLGGSFGALASQRLSVPGLHTFGSIGGIMAGHGAEVAYGLKEWHGLSNFTMEALGTWATLQVAGHYSDRVFGGRVSQLRQVMELQGEKLAHDRPPPSTPLFSPASLAVTPEGMSVPILGGTHLDFSRALMVGKGGWLADLFGSKTEGKGRTVIDPYAGTTASEIRRLPPHLQKIYYRAYHSIQSAVTSQGTDKKVQINLNPKTGQRYAADGTISSAQIREGTVSAEFEFRNDAWHLTYESLYFLLSSLDVFRSPSRRAIHLVLLQFADREQANAILAARNEKQLGMKTPGDHRTKSVKRGTIRPKLPHPPEWRAFHAFASWTDREGVYGFGDEFEASLTPVPANYSSQPVGGRLWQVIHYRYTVRGHLLALVSPDINLHDSLPEGIPVVQIRLAEGTPAYRWEGGQKVILALKNSPDQGGEERTSAKTRLYFGPMEGLDRISRGPSGLVIRPAEGADILEVARGIVNREKNIPNRRVVLNLQAWKQPWELGDALRVSLQAVAENSGLTIAVKWNAAPYAVEFLPLAEQNRQIALGSLAAAEGIANYLPEWRSHFESLPASERKLMELNGIVRFLEAAEKRQRGEEFSAVDLYGLGSADVLAFLKGSRLKPDSPLVLTLLYHMALCGNARSAEWAAEYLTNHTLGFLLLELLARKGNEPAKKVLKEFEGLKEIRGGHDGKSFKQIRSDFKNLENFFSSIRRQLKHIPPEIHEAMVRHGLSYFFEAVKQIRKGREEALADLHQINETELAAFFNEMKEIAPGLNYFVAAHLAVLSKEGLSEHAFQYLTESLEGLLTLRELAQLKDPQAQKYLDGLTPTQPLIDSLAAAPLPALHHLVAALIHGNQSKALTAVTELLRDMDVEVSWKRNSEGLSIYLLPTRGSHPELSLLNLVTEAKKGRYSAASFLLERYHGAPNSDLKETIRSLSTKEIYKTSLQSSPQGVEAFGVMVDLAALGNPEAQSQLRLDRAERFETLNDEQWNSLIANHPDLFLSFIRYNSVQLAHSRETLDNLWLSGTVLDDPTARLYSVKKVRLVSAEGPTVGLPVWVVKKAQDHRLTLALKKTDWQQTDAEQIVEVPNAKFGNRWLGAEFFILPEIGGGHDGPKGPKKGDTREKIMGMLTDALARHVEKLMRKHGLDRIERWVDAADQGDLLAVNALRWIDVKVMEDFLKDEETPTLGYFVAADLLHALMELDNPRAWNLAARQAAESFHLFEAIQFLGQGGNVKAGKILKTLPVEYYSALAASTDKAESDTGIAVLKALKEHGNEAASKALEGINMDGEEGPSGLGHPMMIFHPDAPLGRLWAGIKKLLGMEEESPEGSRRIDDEITVRLENYREESPAGLSGGIYDVEGKPLLDPSLRWELATEAPEFLRRRFGTWRPAGVGRKGNQYYLILEKLPSSYSGKENAPLPERIFFLSSDKIKFGYEKGLLEVEGKNFQLKSGQDVYLIPGASGGSGRGHQVGGSLIHPHFESGILTRSTEGIGGEFRIFLIDRIEKDSRGRKILVLKYSDRFPDYSGEESYKFLVDYEEEARGLASWQVGDWVYFVPQKNFEKLPDPTFFDRLLTPLHKFLWDPPVRNAGNSRQEEIVKLAQRAARELRSRMFNEQLPLTQRRQALRDYKTLLTNQYVAEEETIHGAQDLRRLLQSEIWLNEETLRVYQTLVSRLPEGHEEVYAGAKALRDIHRGVPPRALLLKVTMEIYISLAAKFSPIHRYVHQEAAKIRDLLERFPSNLEVASAYQALLMRFLRGDRHLAREVEALEKLLEGGTLSRAVQNEVIAALKALEVMQRRKTLPDEELFPVTQEGEGLKYLLQVDPATERFPEKLWKVHSIGQGRMVLVPYQTPVGREPLPVIHLRYSSRRIDYKEGAVVKIIPRVGGGVDLEKNPALEFFQGEFSVRATAEGNLAPLWLRRFDKDLLPKIPGLWFEHRVLIVKETQEGKVRITTAGPAFRYGEASRQFHFLLSIEEADKLGIFPPKHPFRILVAPEHLPKSLREVELEVMAKSLLGKKSKKARAKRAEENSPLHSWEPLHGQDPYGNFYYLFSPRPELPALYSVPVKVMEVRGNMILLHLLEKGQAESYGTEMIYMSDVPYRMKAGERLVLVPDLWKG